MLFNASPPGLASPGLAPPCPPTGAGVGGRMTSLIPTSCLLEPAAPPSGSRPKPAPLLSAHLQPVLARQSFRGGCCLSQGAADADPSQMLPLSPCPSSHALSPTDAAFPSYRTPDGQFCSSDCHSDLSVTTSPVWKLGEACSFWAFLPFPSQTHLLRKHVSSFPPRP